MSDYLAVSGLCKSYQSGDRQLDVVADSPASQAADRRVSGENMAEGPLLSRDALTRVLVASKAGEIQRLPSATHVDDELLVRPWIERIEGVGKVELYGVVPKEIRIDLDAARI